MTIHVELPPETERKLRERAASAGRDVAILARELIERGVDSRPTFDEILAPFRQQVAESGITDGELTSLFEKAREDAWRAQDRPSR